MCVIASNMDTLCVKELLTPDIHHTAVANCIHNIKPTAILVQRPDLKIRNLNPEINRKRVMTHRVKQNPAACSGFTYEDNPKVINNNCRSESSRALTLSADLKPVRSSESSSLLRHLLSLLLSLRLPPLSLSLSADWVFGIHNLWWGGSFQVWAYFFI